MNCHACGAQLSANARFCHKCGATVGVGAASGWRAGLPWGLAGAALGALIAVVAMRGARLGAADAQAGTTGPSGGATGPAAIDISRMTPEERANRLFNRVMTLAEAGKTDSVRFFLPMALGAYSQMPALDADARYHIGLLHLAGGDPGGALAEADSIQRAAPSHLFLYVLRAHAYQEQGNQQQERRAYADFLKSEQAEMARNRPEYAEHRDALSSFHQEAVRQAGVRS